MCSVFSFMDPPRLFNIDHSLMEIHHGTKQHQKFNQMNSQSTIKLQISELNRILSKLKRALLPQKVN